MTALQISRIQDDHDTAVSVHGMYRQYYLPVNYRINCNMKLRCNMRCYSTASETQTYFPNQPKKIKEWRLTNISVLIYWQKKFCVLLERWHSMRQDVFVTLPAVISSWHRNISRIIPDRSTSWLGCGDFHDLFKCCSDAIGWGTHLTVGS